MIIVAKDDVHFVETKEDIIQLLPDEVRDYMDEIIDDIVEKEVSKFTESCHYDCSAVDEAEAERDEYCEELCIVSQLWFDYIYPMLSQQQQLDKNIEKMNSYLSDYR